MQESSIIFVIDEDAVTLEDDVYGTTFKQYKVRQADAASPRALAPQQHP